MRKLTGALWALLIAASVSAQDAGLARSENHGLTDSLWSIYQSSRGENLALYRGRQILGGYPGIGGSAFYPFTDWVTGSVQYENVWYRDIELLYDIYRDELLVRHPSGIPFALYGGRVQSFQLRDRKFVRLETGAPVISPAFYEVISEGSLTVYSHRYVILDEKIVDQAISRNFVNRHKYYAYINGRYRAFSKQKQLMDMVKDQRSRIQPKLRASNLKFRHNPDAVIKLIADTYNQPNS